MTAAQDPRTEMEPTVRPLVERTQRIVPFWAIVSIGLALGLLLFLELNARRVTRSAPSVGAPATSQARAEFPPLYLPRVAGLREPVEAVPPLLAGSLPPSPAAAPIAMPAPIFSPPVAPSPVFPAAPQSQHAPARSEMVNDQVLILDTTVGDSTGAIEGSIPTAQSNVEKNGARAPAPSAEGASALVRAKPGNLLNRATIISQGTLIPAVLETALDSTRSGATRALVTRDVVGFDGTRVLIPRGSRLYGEYRAEVAPGQKRALVIWTRLVRPDGVSLALDSPAADPLGRNGIKGRVDSHFIERFGSALLQTALNIGANVAAREISRGSVAVIALPGAAATATSGTNGPLVGNEQFQRTLTVRQGVSVSVFVSRDLDFTGVEAR